MHFGEGCSNLSQDLVIWDLSNGCAEVIKKKCISDLLASCWWANIFGLSLTNNFTEGCRSSPYSTLIGFCNLNNSIGSCYPKLVRQSWRNMVYHTMTIFRCNSTLGGASGLFNVAKKKKKRKEKKKTSERATSGKDFIYCLAKGVVCKWKSRPQRSKTCKATIERWRNPIYN